MKKEAQRMLEKWEQGDPPTVSLWKKDECMGILPVSKRHSIYLVLSFEKEFYESEIYKHGKEIVLDGPFERACLKKTDDGAVVADLTGYSLDEKVLLRSNGTSVLHCSGYLPCISENTISIIRNNQFM